MPRNNTRPTTENWDAQSAAEDRRNTERAHRTGPTQQQREVALDAFFKGPEKTTKR
ncbi:MAG TPA: hypothetical protein VGX23_14205 [Actinocrinis sp.]|nr:hypothetical protein [Actinocrinis sp.]